MSPPNDTKPRAREWWIHKNHMSTSDSTPGRQSYFCSNWKPSEGENLIHVIEHSAYEAMKLERDEFKNDLDECYKDFCQASLDFANAADERDALKEENERLRAELKETNEASCTYRTKWLTEKERTGALRADLKLCVEALELVEPWLTRLSGVIGNMSDANLRAHVRETLAKLKGRAE